ncbi:acyl-CoA dehydrogenase family protein [Candidatus Poriferisocius sp.]|uniref:acyl-CoA dehydrogenase family protein n=1 Tax=Candidatus Poriferisocius sp. TaxID=3101276 RepID=UPI003B516259
MNPERLSISASSSDEEIRVAVAAWVTEHVPEAWRDAAPQGRRAIREVRPRADYEAWYPTLAASGLAVATWPVEYGGLDLPPAKARVAEAVLVPLNLGRLNPLGLHNTAPALFAHGTEEQRLRFLPPMVANQERWCQMFSEPGAGSDLASLAMRAERDGDEWILTGQKVWSTWAHESEFAICLARTDSTVPKRRGITYFLVELSSPGVEVRPLRHIGGEIDFNEVWLEEVRVPDFHRVGAAGDGWRVAASTLAGERQMVAGSGSGGVDRIGGGGIESLLQQARQIGIEGVGRNRLTRLYCEEMVRSWTNERVRATVKAGGTPGPAASIGKVQQSQLNQALQLAAADLMGMASVAWMPGEPDPGQDSIEAWAAAMPYASKGMLRSRANTIEGGTTEVNKNVIGEKVLGLPREPDPYHDMAWQEVPR